MRLCFKQDMGGNQNSELRNSRQQTGCVTRNPVRHGRRARERPSRSQAKTPIALDIGVVRQEACREPAGSPDKRCPDDMPASGVEAVGRVGEGNGDAEANAPRWDRHELCLDGLRMDGACVSAVGRHPAV
jgi:hypothetical protein